MTIAYKTEADAVQELERMFGPHFADYRRAWERANRLELETDFPLFLHIEPNFKCNLRCPMCTQGVPELKAKFGYDEELTTEHIDKILREGRDHGCPSVSFQGDNEPFLIKEIPRWFAMAREYGFLDVMVNTNGTVMTDRLAEAIVTSGLTRLRFSLDAITEDTYRKI